MTVKVKDATVKTATVQLRIIEVNGNKMTLSVFKQIPESDPWWHGDYFKMACKRSEDVSKWIETGKAWGFIKASNPKGIIRSRDKPHRSADGWFVLYEINGVLHKSPVAEEDVDLTHQIFIAV